MKLKEIQKVLAAELAYENDFSEIEIKSCHASDLISDLLTFSGESPLLLTGLTNVQVMRSADILDIAAICFVRGKVPQPETIKLAKEKNIPLLVTNLLMYESSGRLYKAGLPPGK